MNDVSNRPTSDLTVRGGGLRATIAPGRGGRVRSIRSDSREWLVADRSDDDGLTGGLTDVFRRPGMGGWDECFPTVAACEVDVDGRSVALGDHGHLWNRAWTVEAHTPERVSLSLVDPVLGVNFSRTVSGFGAGLRFEYRITVPADGAGELPWLWSLHPQFQAEEGSVVRLPRSVGRELVTEHGERLTLGDGALLATLGEGEGRKTFLPPDRRTDRATLRHPGGEGLTLRWDQDQLPYLGLWWDRAAASDTLSIAIEPTTGFGDRLDTAHASGRAGVLAPGEERSWWLELEPG